MNSSRAATSRAYARVLAPVAAVLAAVLIGGVIIALMGRSPAAAFEVYFVEPLTQGWALQEIAVKATPLLHHRGRPVLLLPRQPLEHRRGGPVHHGRAGRQHPAAADRRAPRPAPGCSSLIARHGRARRRSLYALIPALLRVAFGVSEILTSLMLVYVADLTLDYLVRGPWRDPKGFNFPQTVNFDAHAAAILAEGGRLHAGVLLGPRRWRWSPGS